MNPNPVDPSLAYDLDQLRERRTEAVEPAGPSPEEIAAGMSQLAQVQQARQQVATGVEAWAKAMKKTFKGVYTNRERIRALRAMQRRIQENQ